MNYIFYELYVEFLKSMRSQFLYKETRLLNFILFLFLNEYSVVSIF